MRRHRITARHAIAAIAIAAMAASSARVVQAADAVSFVQANGVISLGAGARRLETLAHADVPVLAPYDAAALIDAAPGLAPSCDAIVNGWGEQARGTATVTAHQLGRSPGTVWIAYRCASSDARFSRYYTERLAALDMAGGAIRFFNLDSRDKGDEPSPISYYHVAGAASFFVYCDSDTPNTRAPQAIAEDRLLIITGVGAAMRPALWLLTMRKQRISANGSDVHAVTYRARIKYVHDAAGRLDAIISYRPAGSAGFGPARPIAIRYAWNPRVGFEPRRERR